MCSSDLKCLGDELIERLLAIDGDGDFVSLVAQNGAQPFCYRTVVVRDEYLGAFYFRFWDGSFLLVRWLI